MEQSKGEKQQCICKIFSAESMHKCWGEYELKFMKINFILVRCLVYYIVPSIFPKLDWKHRKKQNA